MFNAMFIIGITLVTIGMWETRKGLTKGCIKISVDWKKLPVFMLFLVCLSTFILLWWFKFNPL